MRTKLSSLVHSGQYLISHRQLLWRVTRSEMTARYAGSIFGIGWAVLTPLLILVIYSVVYLVIFRVRVPGLSSVDYVLFIFSGLVPFLMTSEALSTGVGSVVANKSVLSNTVFPIDLAPAKAVLLSQVTMGVGMIVILAAAFSTGHLFWTALLLPVIWGLHMFALIGVVWMLSLINLVFRDLQNLVSLAVMILMIASPIAYTPEMVPDSLRLFIAVNPLAYFVTTYQQILIFGQWPGLLNSIVLVVMSVTLFALGGYFFARSKRALIDYV